MAALGVLAVIIGADVYFIVAAAPEGPPAQQLSEAASSAPADSKGAPASSQVAPALSVEPALPLDFQDVDMDDDAGKSSARHERRHYSTVRQAAARSCSTASVDGLSRQIIGQARCIDPDAFVPLPSRPNLEKNSHVYPYFRAAAQRHLLRVLDKHKNKTMIMHSALRTIAQQYLVWRWAAAKRCSIQLAADPGESNHETGLALDISHPGEWRSALESEGFRWLGSKDKVHFDYKGAGVSSTRKIDVLAFQQLWNENHPDDRITEDGRYGAAMQKRLEKAPADGFPRGPTCGKRR